MCMAAFSVPSSLELGGLTSLVLQIRKLRHRELWPKDPIASKVQMHLI